MNTTTNLAKRLGRHLIAFAGRPGSGRTTAARTWMEARNEALREMGAKPQAELRGIDLSLQTFEEALDALDTVPVGGGAVIYDVDTPEQAAALREAGVVIFWVEAYRRHPEGLEAGDFGPTVRLSAPPAPATHFAMIHELAVSGLPLDGNGVVHRPKHYA